MKISVILAISVIFASGTSAAFAEEPIPEMIFEGGTYEIYKGNQILVPVTIQVENHDHQIRPNILTIFENQVIKTSELPPAHSGSFHTLLFINENYETGEYYLQLQYGDQKMKPEPFTITREHLGDQTIRQQLTSYDFSKPPMKESLLKLSTDDITVDFSFPVNLEITGQFGDHGSKGLITLDIDGQKSQEIRLGYNKTGYFETRIVVDASWPSGKYTLNAMGDTQPFATSTFNVKNLNEKKPGWGLFCVPKCGEQIAGTVEVESTTSNDFNILLITGSLQGDNLPETVGIKISTHDNTVEVITAELELDGSFDTSLVLYDYSSRSSWDTEKYTVELVKADENHESYSITNEFTITESGNVITDTTAGVNISELGINRQIEFGENIQNEIGTTNINVFGNLDDHDLIDYHDNSPIELSVVAPDGEIRKFSVFGKTGGAYSMPLFIDDTWMRGEYDVYVKYNDISKNTISFNLGEKLELQIEDVDELIIEENEIVLDKFDIVFDDFHKTEFVTLSYSTTDTIMHGESTILIFEKPGNLKENLYALIDNDGNIQIPLLIDNSWAVGNYALSINENNEITKFAEFTIANEEKHDDGVFILGRHLPSANPDTVYPSEDKLVIENNPILLTHDHNTYLKISGAVANYNSGDIEIQIYKGKKIVSDFKIKPMSNGNFLNTLKVDTNFEPGFFEIHAIYDDRKFATSEFLIVKRNIITAQFGSEPVKISRDMFVESGGLVTVKLTGPINNYEYRDSGMIVFTILKPNGVMETFETEIKKWGYFVYNIPVTSEWQNGTYIISAQLGEKKAGHMYLQVVGFDTQWIKNMTHDWITDDISTYQYSNRLDVAIEDDTIRSQSIEHEMIPNWFKNTANLWVDDSITEKEFFNVLKFLTT